MQQRHLQAQGMVHQVMHTLLFNGAVQSSQIPSPTCGTTIYPPFFSLLTVGLTVLFNLEQEEICSSVDKALCLEVPLLLDNHCI